MDERIFVIKNIDGMRANIKKHDELMAPFIIYYFYMSIVFLFFSLWG